MTNEEDDSRETIRLNNFVTQIIDEDIAKGKLLANQVRTRFPPEPNGWLHLGHAKSICLNFGIAKQYGGRCHLRFDDTNPTVEEDEYIKGIEEDVRWLGFDWGQHLYHSSDYFDQLYAWAELLIDKGLAYVDEQTEEELRESRGSLILPGRNSPFRDRPLEESKDMFRRMRSGEFPNGHCVLRAKIDMAHGNMNMRDPLIFRIKHAAHPRTGNQWCIYPIYDFAHGQSDSIEGITHSVCTLEFYDHRALYDWFQLNLDIHRSQQIEFARLNLTRTVMSKRRLLVLVKEGFVRGWDDPRMPTLCGCRRRGYPPQAIREFALDVGVAKRENLIPYERLEHFVRESLKDKPRRFAVIHPLRVTITNWPDPALVEKVFVPDPPSSSASSSSSSSTSSSPSPPSGRELSFGQVLFIEKSDFEENPSNEFFRLQPGGEIKLRYAYWIKCERVVKDAEGAVVELMCSYDPSTKAGSSPSDPRKVKGVAHWLSAHDSVAAEIRMYDYLFTGADPDEGTTATWRDNFNPDSLRVETAARIEASLAEPGAPQETFQFERLGYFCRDPDSTAQRAVFNKTVGLLDSFAAKANEASKEAKSKEADKLARAKAAEERRLKKEAKAAKLAEKSKGAA